MSDVHTHSHESSSNGMGLVFGVIALILLFVFLFYYALPMLQGVTSQQAQPQINVPKQVDVNVNNK